MEDGLDDYLAPEFQTYTIYDENATLYPGDVYTVDFTLTDESTIRNLMFIFCVYASSEDDDADLEGEDEYELKASWSSASSRNRYVTFDQETQTGTISLVIPEEAAGKTYRYLSLMAWDVNNNIGTAGADRGDGYFFTVAPIPLDEMTVLELPEDTTTIGEQAFAGTTAQAIIIHANCESIAADAFDGCTNLEYIICYSTAEITAPDGVKIIRR